MIRRVLFIPSVTLFRRNSCGLRRTATNRNGTTRSYRYAGLGALSDLLVRMTNYLVLNERMGNQNMLPTVTIPGSELFLARTIESSLCLVAKAAARCLSRTGSSELTMSVCRVLEFLQSRCVEDFRCLNEAISGLFWVIELLLLCRGSRGAGFLLGWGSCV